MDFLFHTVCGFANFFYWVFSSSSKFLSFSVGFFLCSVVFFQIHYCSSGQCVELHQVTSAIIAIPPLQPGLQVEANTVQKKIAKITQYRRLNAAISFFCPWAITADFSMSAVENNVQLIICQFPVNLLCPFSWVDQYQVSSSSISLNFFFCSKFNVRNSQKNQMRRPSEVQYLV